MRITIHQPEHLPWLGFFHKISMSDLFVVLDNVQYRKRYFQNRNRIRTKNGWHWITVPVKNAPRDDLIIKDVKIFKDDNSWRKKNLDTIYHNYCKSSHFQKYWNEFKDIYQQDFESLIDFNIALIKLVLKSFKLHSETLFSSNLDVTGKRGNLIFEICKLLQAKTYVSGISGKEYLDKKLFEDNNIEIIFQEFHHPIYSQSYEPFVPCMSAIDLLFNYGDKSAEILQGIGVPVMEELFL